MAYTKASISTPNEFILALRAFAVASGWTVLVESDDLPVDGSPLIVPAHINNAIPGSSNTSTGQLYSRGTYTGSTDALWDIVLVQGGGILDVTLKWRKDGGAWSAEVVYTTTDIHQLSDGVSVQIGIQAPGQTFTAGDTYTITAEPAKSVAYDGKRLVLNSPSGATYAHLRAANGKGIFNTHTTVGHKYGVGLTCSVGFTEIPTSGKWYDQPGVTKNTAGEVFGVGIPLLANTPCNVYFNHIADPSEMIVASVELYPGSFQHIAFGEIYKIGSWTGGTIYSASYSSANMFPSITISQGVVEGGAGHLFGVHTKANTYLRANIDAAPLRSPEVLWAGCAAATGVEYTGKRIALPVVHKQAVASIPRIPHYAYLQSQSSSDYGRNVNTLNCISVNLPLAVYVLRDPDGLENYSQCGYVPGIYFISTRNVSPGSIYSVDYPSSGITYQAFPHSSRGGSLGYDGMAIKQ